MAAGLNLVILALACSSLLTTPPIRHLCPMRHSSFSFFLYRVLKFNYKILELLKIYNFGFDHFYIIGHLKNLNFKWEKFKRNFPWIDDFK
jgi:hypothetical protein